MRLAVLADAHGNIDALRAVITDLKQQSPDLTVNLGDCLSGPLWPAETAGLLMDQGWPTVRGNHDRWLTAPPDPPGPWEADALPHLTKLHHAWLDALPATRVVDDAFLCHATPQSDTTYWLHEARADGAFARSLLPRITPRAEGISQSLILCGHTHIARDVHLADGRMVVNPGSVGCPGFDDDAPVYHRAEAGSPHAACAVLDRTAGGRAVSFRRNPHDTRRAVALAAARGRPDWASVLATGFSP
jgi:diadenosine tetraphosphatase ApaH/serine/threonine PP2A family protein phosphatase